MNNQKVVVYADLNCPFCFALHERLLANNYIEDVEWRSIVHAPDITFDIKDYLMQSELSEEVTKVRMLAEEINIMVPRSRPNTAEATRIVTEISKIDPDKGSELRKLFYRELWVNGNDISDPWVIESLLEVLELDMPTISIFTIEQLLKWQEEWEQGDFSRNIPALISKDGNKLLGLPSLNILSAFFSGEGNESRVVLDGICYSKEKENLLIFSTSKTSTNNIKLALGREFTLSYADSMVSLMENCVSDQQLDLIIVAESASGDCTIEVIRQLREISKLESVPIIYISLFNKTESEILAFELGANDYLCSSFAKEVLLARARIQLRLKRMVDLLEQHARMDSLTGIPNRREYNHVIEREWRKAVRSKSTISIILVDIDYFKRYNDHYGHMQGDICLCNIAQLLDSNIRRASDVVARFGGEEFVVVLPDTDMNGALALAKNIRESLALKNIPNENSPLKFLTLCQGIASMQPTTSSQLNDLVSKADSALYEAKNAGRDQIKP